MKMTSIKTDSVYPAEWSDDQVMNVLFSPFRENRYVNPRSWDSKLKFWADMIRRHCRSEKMLIFNARQLPGMFERNGKVPACLNIVLDDLLKRGVIQPLSRYTASSSGWISWSLDTLVRRPVQWGYQAFVRQPLSWAYSKLTSGSHGTDLNQPRSSGQLATELPDEHYVILDLVKEAANAIYERHCSSVACRLTDEVIGYDDLARQCKDICTNEQSFDVALLELCSQKRCVTALGPHGEKVIRMVSNRSEKIASFSDTDMKIYRLKTAEVKLEEAIKKTAAEMEQCRAEAKMYLQQGKKSAALKCLRRKKLLDTRQEQHEQAVDKINSLLSMLQETESQKQILDAYASGVEAFKELRTRHDLTEDVIDETMIKIQEVFDDNEMLNQALIQPLPGDVGDDDLERELDDLLASNRNAVGVSTPVRPIVDHKIPQFDVNDLPHVPRHEPIPSPAGSSSATRQLPGRRLVDGM